MIPEQLSLDLGEPPDESHAPAYLRWLALAISCPDCRGGGELEWLGYRWRVVVVHRKSCPTVEVPPLRFGCDPSWRTELVKQVAS